MKAKQKLQEILKHIDVVFDGERDWDVKVLNEKFYNRVLSGGKLALAESYIEGWWECKKLDQFFCRALSIDLQKKVGIRSLIWPFIKAKFLNLQKIEKVFIVGEQHYDVGNDLYEKMLDKRLVYTCAYWKNTNNLDEAQEAKMDLICKKLNLQKGQRILDIGCGWGSFMKFASEKYGVECVGLTVSKEQIVLGEKLCDGLPVQFILSDYRTFKDDKKFDHIVSIGMFEHVGKKNYDIYFKVARNMLKDDGLFLLHTIAHKHKQSANDPFVEKYIFPGGSIPCIQEIGQNIQGKFIMEDWHNFGAYYDLTLMEWYKNFEAHFQELSLNDPVKYNSQFYRIWKYYLLLSAGCFRARYTQLWQIVLSKKGVSGGYTSVR